MGADGGDDVLGDGREDEEKLVCVWNKRTKYLLISCGAKKKIKTSALERIREGNTWKLIKSFFIRFKCSSCMLSGSRHKLLFISLGYQDESREVSPSKVRSNRNYNFFWIIEFRSWTGRLAPGGDYSEHARQSAFVIKRRMCDVFIGLPPGFNLCRFELFRWKCHLEPNSRISCVGGDDKVSSHRKRGKTDPPENLSRNKFWWGKTISRQIPKLIKVDDLINIFHCDAAKRINYW